MAYDARIVCFKLFIFDPIDDIAFSRRPIGVRRPACPLVARPFGDASKYDSLIAQPRDARIKDADHFPIGTTGTDVLGAEQQMRGEAFDHANIAVAELAKIWPLISIIIANSATGESGSYYCSCASRSAARAIATESRPF